MPVAVARAYSCTPSSSYPSRNTPRPTAPVPSGHSTRSCFIRRTVRSRGCWSSSRAGGSSGSAASGVSSICRPMRIARIELYALELPFAEPFSISGGRIDARASVVVVLHDDAGHVGYGEAAPDELPFYSEETLGSARDLLTRALAPRVAGREFDSPDAVDAALRDNVRRNPFAPAGVETAAGS